MTDITPTPDWTPVRQLETTDKVLGGPLPEGVANLHAQALSNQNLYARKHGGTLPFLPGLTYDTGDRVKLASGEIVKSTINGNTNNPNVDMTGWRAAPSASEFYITPENSGLTKWQDFKKPPYSELEYEQAYNNGVRLANAIQNAYAAGFSGVVLEKGKYPLLYQQNAGQAWGIAACALDGLSDFDINLGGSTLFAIFDSNNKSPYDKTTNPPYLLNGSLISPKNSTNLVIRNAYIRGDQYNRSWVVGESNTEHTAGIKLLKNCINTKIKDIEFTGFRGDGINGEPKGDQLYNLSTWYSGGISETGGEISEVGTYRTLKLDLQGLTIYRNSIQINTTGYLRSPPFRNEVLRVFFYNTNGVFQLSEKVRHTDFIYLPRDCRFVQFVAYNDERTTSTVSYGGNDLYLASGNSEFAEILSCKFYENHRGGVANMCGSTIIDHCDFYDEGGGKQGFGFYTDPTRYAINFEDIYVSSLTVTNTKIRNHTQAILCNSANLFVSGCNIKDVTFFGVGGYSCYNSIVSGNVFENVGDLFSVSSSNDPRKRYFLLSNNIIRDAWFTFDISASPTTFVSISDNNFLRSKISLKGDRKNLCFDNNRLVEVFGRYINTSVVKNALSCSNNVVLRNSKDTLSDGWSVIDFSGTQANNNYVFLDSSVTRLTSPVLSNEVLTTSGVVFESNNKELHRSLVSKTQTGFSDHIDNYVFSKVSFSNVRLKVTGTGELCGGSISFSDCKFLSSQIQWETVNPVGTNAYTILFKNVEFNVDNVSYIFNVSTNPTNPVNIVFENCVFTSTTLKTISLLQGTLSKVTAIAKDCKFINVINSSTVLQIDGSVSEVYDPPTINVNSSVVKTISLNGVKVGDLVGVAFSQYNADIEVYGAVSSNNTVTVKFKNTGVSPVDLESGTLTVRLI